MPRKKSSKRPSVKHDPAVGERIVAAALAHPDFGVRRLTRFLKNEGITASESAIQTTLRTHGLHPCKLRLALLEKRHLNEGLQLTEEQKTALQNFKTGIREPAPIPPPAAVLPEPPEKLEERPPAPAAFLAFSPEPEKDAGPEPAAHESVPAPALDQRALEISAAAPIIDFPMRKRRKKAGRSRWVFRGFKIALVCLAIYMGAGTALKIRELLYQAPESSMLSTAQSEPDIRNAQSKVRSNPVETYRVIWERNLFKVAEPAKKQKPPESIDVDKIAVAENNIGLKLIGTVLANDPRLNSAIINVDATRRQGVFREKESVGGFLIKGILRNSIIIENDKGQLKRLIVENADLTTIGASKASQPKPAEPRADSNPPLEFTSTPAAVEIRRAEVRSALTGIQRSNMASSFSPYLFDGKPDGFYIVNPGPKGILTRIGLRTGDLVRGVEGMQLERPGDSVGFFERLLEGGEFSVLVQRGDQIQVLQLVIN